MQGNDIFRLVVRRGPQPNQTYDLIKDLTTLGRDITNDIVINDPECSRHHLRITRTAEGCTIEDLGSTNGTFVNGQRVSGSRPLNNGDMIGLGETVTLGYERVRPAGDAVPPTNPAGIPQAPQNAPYAQPAQQPGYGQQPQSQPGYNQQPGYNPQPGQANYNQPGQPAGYNQQPAQQYYAPNAQPPAADYGGVQNYGAPQSPAGYDYDPYAIREEEPRNAMRWVFIGCAGLTVFCCCSSVVGLVIIDTLSLWYNLPIVKDIAPLLARLANLVGLGG